MSLHPFETPTSYLSSAPLILWENHRVENGSGSAIGKSFPSTDIWTFGNGLFPALISLPVKVIYICGLVSYLFGRRRYDSTHWSKTYGIDVGHGLYNYPWNVPESCAAYTANDLINRSSIPSSSKGPKESSWASCLVESRLGWPPKPLR